MSQQSSLTQSALFVRQVLTANIVGIISTSDANTFTYAAAAIGALYGLSGALILTMKKWAVAVALVLPCIVVLRIALVVTGLYPVDTFRQISAILIGTGLAIAFGVYIGWQWKRYR